MMLSHSSHAVWLLAGLDAVLLAIIGFILFMYIRNKRRDTAGLSQLVRTIKENEPAQLEALRSALKEEYGQSEEVAAENAKKLAKVKKSFYKHLINVHLARDGEAFAALDPRLDELLTAYRTLMPVTAEQSAPAQSAAEQNTADTAAGDDKDYSADLEEIKRQNEELKRELDETKRSLDEALNEYASAYSGGAEAGKERLENEMHKLHDKKEQEPAQETAAPAPNTGQEDNTAGQSAESADTAPINAGPEETVDARKPAPDEDAAGQSQDDIDQLMEDIPNLDGMLVQELDDKVDSGEADAVAATVTDSETLESSVEKQAQ